MQALAVGLVPVLCKMVKMNVQVVGREFKRQNAVYTLLIFAPNQIDSFDMK
jgi:hypothetical protein